MRQGACAVLLSLLSSAALTFAQEPRSRSADTPGPQAVQVTGCVLTVKEYAVATTLSPATANGASFVVLDSPIAYALTGGHAVDWSEHLHRRVAISGNLIPARNDQTSVPSTDAPVATSGAAGRTPSGSPAHEAADATSGAAQTARERDGAQERNEDAQTVRRLPTLMATTVKPTGETCDERGVLLGAVASASSSKGAPDSVRADADRDANARSSGSAPAAARVPERLDGAAAPAMIATGCLVAQSGTPTVTLERATVKSSVVVDPRSAVPGSRPASQGTGTVQPTASDAKVADASFLIVNPSADLRAKAGSYVEITGAVDEPAGRGGDAHESSPASRLTPQSVRVLRDRCP